jgi:hypothetical protein
MARTQRQLKLPLPGPTKADIKAVIRDRLDGYEVRQAAREHKRRETARKRALRAAKRAAGVVDVDPQLTIPGVEPADVNQS